MREVIIPRPPALETAAARSAVPRCIMPPWTTGTVEWLARIFGGCAASAHVENGL